MMRRPSIRLTLSLVAALSACSVAQDNRSELDPIQEPASAEAIQPMTSFARFVGGEWRYGSAYHAWCWGPGNYSLRKMTHGFDPAANAWAGEVVYWHPGLGEVRTLGMHGDIPAVGRGVAEGPIRFDGEISTGESDLHQPRGRRKLGHRQTFDGPDKYREELLEDSGAGFRGLAAWDFVRTHERAGAPSRTAERAPIRVPERMRAFEALVDNTWEANGTVGGHAVRIRSKLEWNAELEVVFAHVTATTGDAEPAHVLEAYVYHHLGVDELRCLALSDQGHLHEGIVTMPDGRALQLDLKGYEGDRVVRRVVRFDLESDGELRTRVWSVEGADRTLALDVRHKKLEAKSN